MNLINSTLPIKIRVLKYEGSSRYLLELNKKIISTNSAIKLELNQSYLAQLHQDKNKLVFKTLVKCPNIHYFEEGLIYIKRLLEEEEQSWFLPLVIDSFLKAKSMQEYQLFKQMLFASLQKIYHIPFVLEGKKGLFELKKEGEKLYFYLFFPAFGPFEVFINKGVLSYIKSPFSKVKSFLELNTSLKIEENKDFKSLFNKILDFKG